MQHRHFAPRLVTFFLLALACVARVASAGTETISVTWDASPEGNVVGYRVYVGSEPGVYTTSVDVGSATVYAVASATIGQRYCFAVASYTAGPDLGAKSQPICTEPNKAPVLTVPTGQSSDVGSPASLTLSATDPEGQPVTYSATGLPTGLRITSSTGAIGGTPTAVGNYNVTATVSDGFISASKSFAWSIKAALPAAPKLLGPSGSLATPKPTYEWESVAAVTSYRLWVDDADASTAKIQIDYTPTQAGCATAGAVCRVTPAIGLSAGRGSWSVRAANASGAGPWSGAMDFLVTVGTAPVVTITAPTAAAAFETQAPTLTIGGTASDDTGVTQVTFSVNGAASSVASGTTSWSASGLPLVMGANVITVTARDTNGNVATKSLTVTRSDTSAPTLTISSPTSTGSFSTTAAVLNISGTAADAGGVKKVAWSTDRGTSGTATGSNLWMISGLSLPVGSTTLTVTATDAAGNSSQKVVVLTRTADSAPVVAIAAPTSAETYTTTLASLRIAGSASDNAEVMRVEWANDRGGVGVATGTTTWSATVALLSGVNTITVTATDNLGQKTVDRIVVTVPAPDTKAPVVAVAAPVASGGTFTTGAASVTVSGTGTDDVAVKTVTWSNNRGGAGSAAGTASWSAAIALQAGANVITLTASDAAGNKGTATITVNRDVDAPVLSVIAPTAAPSYATTQTSLVLSGRATDALPVKSVTWQNSRGGAGTAAGTNDWTTGAVALVVGSNVITITASDEAGNTSTAVLTVTVEEPPMTEAAKTEAAKTAAADAATTTTTDSARPVIAVLAPTTTGAITVTEPYFSAAGVASDADGIAQVTWTSSVGKSGVAVGTTSWSISNVPLRVGQNTVTITARDAAGQTTSTTITVSVVDKKAPVVTIKVPTAEAAFTTTSNVVTLGGTATDNFNVARVSWQNDRGGNGWASGNANFSAAVPLQPGVNTITVTGFDSTGNWSTDVIKVTYSN